MEIESKVEARLRKEIRALGGIFWKFTSPGNDGVPDRIAMFPDGRLVFVELKKEDGKLTKLQAVQIRRLVEIGQQVCVVYGKAGADQFLQDMRDHSVDSVSYEGDACIELEPWRLCALLKGGGAV